MTRPPNPLAELLVTRTGQVLIALSVLLMVYALVIAGSILLGVISVLLLLGGYLLIKVLLRAVTAFERIASAYERRVEAELDDGTAGGAEAGSANSPHESTNRARE